MAAFGIEFAGYAGFLSFWILLFFYSFRTQMRGQCRNFNTLNRAPGTPRPSGASSTWLGWVNGAFPPGQVTAPRYTRADALQAFDVSVGSLRSYQALKYFAVAAPLCGVLITTWKFVSNQQQLTEAAAPLFVGVGSGATAALVCQVCLFLANRYWADARSVALDWFDRDVWEKLGHPFDLSSNRVLDSMTQFAESMNEAATRHIELNTVLTRFVRSAGTAAERLGAARVVLNQGADSLVKTLTALDTFLKDRLEPCGVSFHKAAKTVEKWVGQLPVQQQQAEDATTRLLGTVDSLVQSATTLQETAGEHKKQAEELTRDTTTLTCAVTRFDTACKGLTDFETKAVQPIRRGFADLEVTLGKLHPAAEDLRQLLQAQQTLHPLLQSLSQATLVAGAVAQMPAAIRTALDAITTQTQDSLTKQLQAVQQSSAAIVRIPTELTASLTTLKTALESSFEKLRSTLVTSTEVACANLTTAVSGACTTITTQTQDSLKKQLEAVQQSSAAIVRIPHELSASLTTLQAELKSFTEQILVDQVDRLEMTLDQIVGKMNRRNGVVAGS